MATHPACTDQYVKYLAAVELTIEELNPVIEYLCIPEKSIYTWQSYRLWLLMANKKVVSDQLIEAATVSLSAPDSPARAGASIYLGVMGSEKNKLEVAEKFETVRSFIGQRSVLIAIHELPYSSIEGLVKERLRPDLNGVFRTLAKKERRGQYFSPKERMQIGFSGEGGSAYE